MDAEPADTEGQLCSGILYKELERLQILVSEWVLYPNSKHTCMFVLVAQSCPTLCSPMDYSPPGSSVHGIVQARILQWVAISFSRGASRPRDQTQVSCIVGRIFHWNPNQMSTSFFNFWKTDSKIQLGNTCAPVVDSCWCVAEPIQYCKVISLQLK